MEEENDSSATQPSGDELFKETRSLDVITPTLDQVSSPHSPRNLEFEISIDLLREKNAIPPPEIRPAIAQLLEERRVGALMDGDYDSAAEYDRLFQVLQSAIQLEEQKKNEDHVIEVLYQRWQQLQSQQKDVNDKWDQKMTDFLSENDKQQEILREQQHVQIELFLGKWKDPNFLRAFSKPSPKLIQLREQERAMGLARMYSQAKEVRTMADRLQREETQAAQARIHTQMTNERHKLSDKHEKECQALSAYRERMLRSIQMERQKELRPIQTAIQQLKAKKTPPVKRPSSLPSLPSRRADSSCGSSFLAQDSLCSARTAVRYSIFKSERKTTVLDVGPVDDRLLAQMKSPPTARPRSTRARPL
jgi:hypothetical protein